MTTPGRYSIETPSGALVIIEPMPEGGAVLLILDRGGDGPKVTLSRSTCECLSERLRDASAGRGPPTQATIEYAREGLSSMVCTTDAYGDIDRWASVCIASLDRYVGLSINDLYGDELTNEIQARYLRHRVHSGPVAREVIIRAVRLTIEETCTLYKVTSPLRKRR